jgi:mRNA interferase RelE/StbE
MKTLNLTRTAIKDLKSIPPRDRQALMAKLESYAAGEPQDVVALKGSNFLRLRHGAWRAIFAETESAITVATVLHRREAYR